jgi:HNH endonuclease
VSGPNHPRGPSNGSATGRRARKKWLLNTFGDGTVVACQLRCSPKCLGILNMDTLTVDRIIPGADGGTYRRGNIRPACVHCNSLHGDRGLHCSHKGAPVVQP